MSGLDPGGMKDSNALAVCSTDAPRIATETIRPPLEVSRIVRRERHWGQVSLAGGRDMSMGWVMPADVVKLKPDAETLFTLAAGSHILESSGTGANATLVGRDSE
jgi:hypothetical protein